jgi:hypothetical protein
MIPYFSAKIAGIAEKGQTLWTQIFADERRLKPLEHLFGCCMLPAVRFADFLCVLCGKITLSFYPVRESRRLLSAVDIIHLQIVV